MSSASAAAPSGPQDEEEGGDSWRGWAPAEGRGPHAQQERHSPTQSVLLRLSGGRAVQEGRRRVVDARLWEAMTPAQQDAAVEIVFSFQAMSRGLGFAQARLDRLPGGRGGRNPVEPQGAIVGSYVDWARACQAEKVSHAMIVDILVMGLSLSQCDRERRTRKGAARANLMAGLDIYARARGWQK